MSSVLDNLFFSIKKGFHKKNQNAIKVDPVACCHRDVQLEGVSLSPS